MKKHKKTSKGAVRLTSDARPTATNVDWPVFVPNSDGSTNIEVGRARLRYGTLVVEFRDTAAAVAIQNMIERGVLMGFGTIMIKPDIVNEMYQEVVANEEADEKGRQAAIADGALILDADGETYIPAGEALDYDAVIAAYRPKVEVDNVVEYDEAEPNTFQIQTNPDPVIDEVIKNYNEENN